MQAVDGAPLMMEVDTGVSVSLVATYRQLWPDQTLVEVICKLTMYTGEPLNQLNLQSGQHLLFM